MHNPDIVIKMLRMLMAELNLSQAELAKKAGFSTVIVSKWLNGKAFPTKNTLTKIAKATHKPLDYFLCGDVELSNIGNTGGTNTINNNDKMIGVMEKYIARLEAENDVLRAENNRLKNKCSKKE